VSHRIGYSLVPILSVAFLLSGCNLPIGASSKEATATPQAINRPTTESVSLPTQTSAMEITSSGEATLAPQILATPYAQEPAAGICGMAEGTWVTVTIYPDIPDPRCVQVRGDQKLIVVNQTQDTINLSIGPFHTSINPGEDARLDQPFGSYLAPGVHLVEVQPCCGGTIVLKEG
jgi:hypothetical protein